MAVSESKMRANHKWDDANYDRFGVRLPKGSKKIIEQSGMSYNKFFNEAFKEYCENHNIK